MSLINWLSQKPVSKPPGAGTDSRPAAAVAAAPNSVPGSADARQQGRRAERSERREQLYEVVRHAMSSAGVLSASYKFKVLSLDSRGTTFLVMMDMVSRAAEDPSRMSEIESLIAQNAKSRFDIVVAAVYWRLSDYVAAGLSNRSGGVAASGAPGATQAAAPKAEAMQSVATVAPMHRAQAIGAEEVQAFKNAFAAQGKGAPLFSSGEIQKSGRRTVSPPRPDFADTPDSEDRVSPLGPTQYGELN